MGNVVAFIISFGLFLFGMWLMAVAFANEAMAIWIFTGGILAITVAMAIPFSLLGRSDQK